MSAPRRFPPPLQVTEHKESFMVSDASGQTLGYFYFEARRLAANFAKLPTLLRGGCSGPG